MTCLRLLLMVIAISMSFVSQAFQIAPLGSKFEARLTKESPSRLAEIAGMLGVIVKQPVHEEIGQLAFSCPVDPSQIESDDLCGSGDAGFANHFVIYGIRWNDLPPFRLNPGQGERCRKLGGLAGRACNISQTVRFATQPDCWFCLFKEASVVAQSQRITGCEKGTGFIQGNLMTRSHFGDLQFLHAMARDEGTPASVTRQKIIDWIEFAWRVFLKEIRADTAMKDVDIPTIREHFGCSSWTVADIYVLGRGDLLVPKLSDIAFGSVLHTVQDSFAAAHVTREPAELNSFCSSTLRVARPGRVIEFHAYASQDSHRHDAGDSRRALASAAGDASANVVSVSRQLAEYWDANAPWTEVKPFIECVFDLGDSPRGSSAGGFGRESSR